MSSIRTNPGGGPSCRQDSVLSRVATVQKATSSQSVQGGTARKECVQHSAPRLQLEGAAAQLSRQAGSWGHLSRGSTVHCQAG